MSLVRDNRGQFVESDEFMKPDVRIGSVFIVDTNVGTEVVPMSVAGRLEFHKPNQTYTRGRTFEHLVAWVYPYCEGKQIESVTLKKNVWFGRLSAPGYLDCTPWTWATTQRELRSQLHQLYGDSE